MVVDVEALQFYIFSDTVVRAQLTDEGKSVVRCRNSWQPIGDVVTYDEAGWCELPYWQFLGIFGGLLIRKESDIATYFVSHVRLKLE